MPTSFSDRRTAIAVALAVAILEIVMVPWLDEPTAAIVFAVLFVGVAAWIWRGGPAALVTLAALSGLELAFLPAYPRVAFEDWMFQGLTLIFGVTGVMVSLAALRRRARAGASA